MPWRRSVPWLLLLQEHLDDDQVLDWLAQAEVQVDLGDGAAAAAAAAGPGKELPLWFRGTGERGVRLGGWFEPCHVAGIAAPLPALCRGLPPST